MRRDIERGVILDMARGRNTVHTTSASSHVNNEDELTNQYEVPFNEIMNEICDVHLVTLPETLKETLEKA